MTAADHLKTIRERVEKARKTSGVGFALTTGALALDDLPRLLDAVEKVLELHEHRDNNPLLAPHCGFCMVNWPCDTVDAIATALEGK